MAVYVFYFEENCKARGVSTCSKFTTYWHQTARAEFSKVVELCFRMQHHGRLSARQNEMRNTEHGVRSVAVTVAGDVRMLTYDNLHSIQFHFSRISGGGRNILKRLPLVLRSSLPTY